MYFMAKHNQTPGIGIHPLGTMLTKGSGYRNVREQKVPQKPPVSEATCGPVSPRILSIALLNGARELVIEHAGEEYRLRLTSKGKLILTK